MSGRRPLDTPWSGLPEMRILVVMLSVGFAGTERHAVELANALSRECQVALLLRERPRERHRQAQYDALRRAIAPQLPVYLASRAMPAFGLWNAMLRFRPDLIHAHRERSVRIASRFAVGVPVVGTVHVHFRPRDFARCDGLIFLTQAERLAAQGSYSGRSFVVGNWVMPRPRPTATRLAELRTQLGLAEQDYVIGSVARLEPVKGLAGLIEAFHLAQIPEARLLIAGEGSQRAALQAVCRRHGIADRVIFTGFRPDVRDLYPLFDMFVLNSLDEPYGLAILEAAAAGVPVIASDTIGARAIAESLPIRLVAAGLDQALAAALREAACRRPPPNPLPAAFTIEARLPAVVDAYRCVIASRGKRSGGQPRIAPPSTEPPKDKHVA